ncbi:hypothetical protein EON83_00445 [bacterium]|nr:MAG: hypothetical protein EON83_00445 [bacterium]
MFSFLAQLARLKRGDASLFLVAALLAFWAMPVASQSIIASSAHPYEAVLLLLSAEANAPRTHHLGAPTHLEAENLTPDETPLLSNATAHCGAYQHPTSPETPRRLTASRTHNLSAFEVAQLSGVSTNVRLN